MTYRIEKRGALHIVVRDDGQAESEHASRAKAVARIQELDQKPLPAKRASSLKERAQQHAERLNSMSRTGKYRLAKGNPWLQMLLVPEARQRWQRQLQKDEKAGRKAIEWLERCPPGVSGSEWMALRDDDEYMRRHHAKTATTAKKSTADARAKKARALKAQGKTQKQIAATIGITSTRGVRKLLARGR